MDESKHQAMDLISQRYGAWDGDLAEMDKLNEIEKGIGRS